MFSRFRNLGIRTKKYIATRSVNHSLNLSIKWRFKITSTIFKDDCRTENHKRWLMRSNMLVLDILIKFSEITFYDFYKIIEKRESGYKDFECDSQQCSVDLET